MIAMLKQGKKRRSSEGDTSRIKKKNRSLKRKFLIYRSLYVINRKIVVFSKQFQKKSLSFDEQFDEVKNILF
jgi:hypothetical protein